MRLPAVAVVALLLAPGCGSPQQPDLVVFAASSLAKTFTEIGQRFETEYPGADVEFVFAGSADLVTQVSGGARADVLATADPATMNRARQAGVLGDGEPVNFATNTLTIVVARGNPRDVRSVRDLARPGLAVVACAPQVPCGAATAKLENAAGVELDPVSEESSVGDVLTKVTSGQADAGIVYVTDARAAGDTVTAVAIPEAAAAVNTYPIAVTGQSDNPGLAREFIGLVAGPAGQKILAAAGFTRPPA